jgi:tetratricopeptide (TPR) repeat protein
MPVAGWAAAALVACAFALYWKSLGHPLVFDDTHLTASFLRDRATAWRTFELRWLSHATFGWGYQLFGMDWFWHRIGNMLLHAATAVMLFVLLSRLFSVVLPVAGAQERPGVGAGPAAFFGGLLFLVHPVAVYGAAYLIQRSVVMATLFGLAALWLFLEGLVRNGRAWHVASAIAYLAAVFSKEHAVMLPAVAAALVVLVRGRSPLALRSLVLPFALYAAIAALVVLKAKGVLGAQYEPFAAAGVRQLAGPEGIVRSDLYLLSVINQCLLFFRYLLVWLLPLPAWMSVDLRFSFPENLGSPLHVAGVAAWIAWPVAAGILLRRSGHAGLAGLAMLAPWLLALPEMATVRVQEPFVLYRSYLWMSLLPAAIPVLAARMEPRWGYAALTIAFLALLPPFFDRMDTFSSPYKLWDDAVRKNTDARASYRDRAFRSRGVAYYRAGQLKDALSDFNRAYELDPRNVLTLHARGALFLRAGQDRRAMTDLDRALEIDALHVESLGLRCFVLLRARQFDDALRDCELALKLAPDAVDHLISLGLLRAVRRETELAERHYRRALDIDPTSAIARYHYGVLLRGLGRREDALRQFSAACGARFQSACNEANQLRAAQ